MPGDKVDQIEKLLAEKQPKENLAFVGDGINDAPVLSRVVRSLVYRARVAGVVLVQTQLLRYSLCHRLCIAGQHDLCG